MAMPEEIERRRQVRGLLMLAVVAILFAIVRAMWHGGMHSVFPQGWWRVW
jgi:hypothetical protein